MTTLEKWLEVVSNFQKSNYSEWKYLQNRLFPKTVPLHAEWRDIDSIIKILNDIGSMPGLNHMFCQLEGTGCRIGKIRKRRRMYLFGSWRL